jgi:hypothetical protein
MTVSSIFAIVVEFTFLCYIFVLHFCITIYITIYAFNVKDELKFVTFWKLFLTLASFELIQ